MKIGIFGHSKATYKKRSFIHYSERVNKYFPQHQINWYGVFCSSIERLTYLIQKHKCDLYIIFHTSSQFIYAPGLTRDAPWYLFFHQSRRDELLNICKNEGSDIDINSFLTCRDLFYNKKRELNYIAYLFLMKSTLVGKNVIHVQYNGQQETKMFKGAYFSQALYDALYVGEVDTLPHEEISKVFIDEIENRLKT